MKAILFILTLALGVNSFAGIPLNGKKPGPAPVGFVAKLVDQKEFVVLLNSDQTELNPDMVKIHNSEATSIHYNSCRIRTVEGSNFVMCPVDNSEIKGTRYGTITYIVALTEGKITKSRILSIVMDKILEPYEQP